MSDPSLPPHTATRVHHVGMSVANLDDALAFWRQFLGVEPKWRTTLDRPYLSTHLGYSNLSIDAAFLDLPGGIVLELLDYQLDGKVQNSDATANPGNVHLCLEVDDARAAWDRAVAAGATPVVPEGPIEVDGGPNRGARASYLRIHDGISIEFFQPPRA
ncbi:MAG: VOC family protein [Actinobacteria bacterium]|nr:VOC family protein [Actinomycetota bacterium]MBV8395549.1 VOC family protein [Actinomycetota bacterium]MBV8599525.1 VOC family protein [Actinomycetota bacterium]